MTCAALIPAYNAAATLPALLGMLSKHFSHRDIFVVDDGSTDSTAAVARLAMVQVLSHDRNRGKGAALRTGFQKVLLEQRYDAVLTLDADLQHDPEDCPAFLEEWEKGKCDLLIGARRRLGSGMPFHRMLSNGITSFLVSARTGQDIRDSQSGYRLLSTQVLKTVETQNDGYEMETEYIVRAAMKGFRIGFVPIATIYSDAKSHMTHWYTTKKFLTVLLKEY